MQGKTCPQTSLAKNLGLGLPILGILDDQGASKALRACAFRVEVGLESLYLENLAHQNELTLWWVLGHNMISGNEAAWEFWGSCLVTGPKPFCGLSASQFR